MNTELLVFENLILINIIALLQVSTFMPSFHLVHHWMQEESPFFLLGYFLGSLFKYKILKNCSIFDILLCLK